MRSPALPPPSPTAAGPQNPGRPCTGGWGCGASRPSTSGPCPVRGLTELLRGQAKPSGHGLCHLGSPSLAPFCPCTLGWVQRGGGCRACSLSHLWALPPDVKKGQPRGKRGATVGEGSRQCRAKYGSACWPGDAARPPAAPAVPTAVRRAARGSQGLVRTLGRKLHQPLIHCWGGGDFWLPVGGPRGPGEEGFPLGRSAVTVPHCILWELDSAGDRVLMPSAPGRAFSLGRQLGWRGWGCRGGGGGRQGQRWGRHG